MNSANRLWRQDLAWAGLIVLIATAMGMWMTWPQIRSSREMWELPAELSKIQTERGGEVFQGIKTVNLTQAYALFQQGQALFIDARSPDSFAELHIPRALNLSPQMLAKGETEKVSGIPKDQEIVVYCDQVTCDLAIEVAEKLQSLGFTRVKAFMQGFRSWDQAGYPADTSR